MEEKLMEVNELAKYLCLDRQTVYRKAKNKEIPSVRIGRTVRFKKSDIDKWLAKRGD